MTQFPEVIQEKIDALVEKIPLEKLIEGSENLQRLYRERNSSERNSAYPSLKGSISHLAYLASRMPATFAAVLQTFKYLIELCPTFSPRSLLDLGAGPGTGLFAANMLFDSLKNATLIERDPLFVDLAKDFYNSYSFNNSYSRTNNSQIDVAFQLTEFGSFLGEKETVAHDLVLFSYSLGELDALLFQQILDLSWSRTLSHLVIIEPGTPRGYATIMKAREFLLLKGAKIIAPCPHQAKCPIKENEWCHFAARLSRSRLHRKIKGADLGFEDEKFSYLIVSRTSEENTKFARVIRSPCKRSGHIHFTFCTPQGEIEETIISKRTKERFLLAKKAEWGDILPI